MSKYIAIAGILIIMMMNAPITTAEKATELYIPIGQSPGLSDKYVAAGRIEQVNYQKNTLTMSSDSRTYTVTVSERTKYYLDRSKTGRTNLYGSFSDCKQGMMVEVRFEKDERNRPAEWIKLEMPE